jgi:hypothetical protein
LSIEHSLLSGEIASKALKHFETLGLIVFYLTEASFSYLLENPVYFFSLMKKSNKKNQGFRKMAKNYFVNLNAGNSLRAYICFENTSGSNNPAFLSAKQKDGLLRNFLNAIFLRPPNKYFHQLLFNPDCFQPMFWFYTGKMFYLMPATESVSDHNSILLH